jgi:hypothetical protein
MVAPEKYIICMLLALKYFLSCRNSGDSDYAFLRNFVYVPDAYLLEGDT